MNLYAQLSRFGRVAARQCATVVRATGASGPELSHYADTAAFLAFIDLGGKVETPDEFEWSRRKRKFLKRTQFHLRKLLRGPDTGWDEDRAARSTRLHAGADVVWGTWRRTPSTSRRGTTTPARAETHDSALYSDDVPQLKHETQLAVDEGCNALSEVLAETLTPTELDAVVGHYFKGLSQRELALRLVQDDPRYAEVDQDTAEANAHNMVLVRVSRARSKLRKALGPEWRELLSDLREVA